jgi:hypothetical protein
MQNPSFHTSTWPSGPIRVPGLATGQVSYSEDFLYFDLDSYREARPDAELPEGAYRHELVDLDLTCAADVARFVEKFGYPSGEAGGEGPPWEDLRRLWVPIGDEWVPKPLPECDEAMDKQLLEHKGWWAYPLSEFRERASLVMDLTETQAYLQERQSLDQLRQSWRSGLVAPPANRQHATVLFHLNGNWALKPFQPLFEISAIELGLLGETARFEHAMITPQPRLFEALILQLFNEVSASLKFRRCANAKCGAWFPLTRPDRIYCDMLCARAQNQRQLQRRHSKRWRTAARDYVTEIRASKPSATLAELHEGFSAAFKDQPFNDADQFRSACEGDASGKHFRRGPKNQK